jgi:hypothetical protein
MTDNWETHAEINARRTIIGEPFTEPTPVKPEEPRHLAVVQVAAYGRRVILVKLDPGGTPKPPRVKNCYHGRALIPRLYAGGDYAQICRLCAYETERLEV